MTGYGRVVRYDAVVCMVQFGASKLIGKEVTVFAVRPRGLCDTALPPSGPWSLPEAWLVSPCIVCREAIGTGLSRQDRTGLISGARFGVYQNLPGAGLARGRRSIVD